MIDELHGRRVYIDSNVFIYSLQGFAKYLAASEAIMSSIDQRKFEAVTSELTLAEVLVKPYQINQKELIDAFEGILRPRPSLELVQVTASILRDSAKWRASAGGKLPDAIHVATAMACRATAFITADRRIKSPENMEFVLLDSLNRDQQG